MLSKRRAGVLMHVSSLPSPYGVGVFGGETLHFIDKLQQMSFRFWQVLPFNPIDETGSPYRSESAFAGNLLFIDPATLAKDGYCTEAEARENEYPGSPYTADYGFALEKRLALLRRCFDRMTAETAEKVRAFEQARPWVGEYALYKAIKETQDDAPWWTWPEQYRRFRVAWENRRDLEERSAFYKFCQYLFCTQWERVKAYAHKHEVAVIGDMPIYLAPDSADVWAHAELFQLDPDTLRPTKVAGVPPDYFSEDGQLWGNPLYDWDALKKTGYAWWLDRIENALTTYDVVRIDHFRAFASYWEIPADSETAKNGDWAKGPGMDLFEKVFARFPDAPIIAEDLGTFGEDVVKLLQDTGFPGMRVVQFGFDPNGDSTHMPHNAPHNCVNYAGTHDNNTLLGYLWEAKPDEKRFALDYCGFKGDNWGEGGYQAPACRAIIETVWKSAANTAVAAFQDLCGFGADARMNTPGTDSGNWLFRTTRETIDKIDADYFCRINRLYRRWYGLTFDDEQTEA